MIIQSPNAREVKFLIPEVLAEVDRGAEPTAENIGALNLSKDIIAAGGVIAGLWEKPQFRPTLGTDLLRGANSTFESEVNDWDTSDAGVDITGGKLVFTAVANGDGAEITVPVAPVLYATSITIDGHSAGSIRIIVGSTNGTARAANGTFPENIIAGGGTTIRIEAVAAPATLNVTIATVVHKALWRIDAALSRRPRRGLDFVLLAQQNLLDVYESAIRSVVDVYSAPTDALPAMPIEVSRYMSGLLGEGAPFMSYDGVISRTVVADNANLNFGAFTNFEIHVLFRTSTLAGGRFGQKGGGPLYMFGMGASGVLVGQVNDGVSSVDITSANKYNDGEWHYGIFSCHRKGNGTIIVDDVTDGFVDISGIGDLDDITRPFTMGVNSDLITFPLDGDLKVVSVFNRLTTPEERTALFNDPFNYPVSLQDGSQANLITNSGFEVDVADWVPQNPTAVIAQVVDAPTGGGTKSLELTAVGFNDRARANDVIFVEGETYHIDLWYKVVNGVGTFTLRQQNLVGDLALDISASNALTATSWTHISFEYTAQADAPYLGVWKRGGASDEIRIDSVITTKTGIIAAWQPDGISISQGLLLDASSNNLHGVMTGVDVWNAPDVNTPGYFLQQFTAPVSDRYLFARFNPAVLAALAALRMGWLMWGSIYSFLDLGRAGFGGAITWPGVIKNTSDAGVTITESRHGLRPVFDVTLIAMGTDDWQDVQDLVERLQGCLHAFYIILDNAAGDPVLWQVRLDADVGFTWVTGDKDNDTWEGVRFRILTEGR